MKRIELHRSFIKSFTKRIVSNKKLRDQYQLRMDMFIAGHRTAPINDHPLTGNLLGRRAFSINVDIRVIYIELEDKIILLDIGTHNQVY